MFKHMQSPYKVKDIVQTISLQIPYKLWTYPV